MLNQTVIQTYQTEIQIGVFYLILVGTYYFFAQNRRIKKTLKKITEERRALVDEKSKIDHQLIVTQYYAIGAMKLNIIKTLDRLKINGETKEFEVLESGYRALIHEAARYNTRYDHIEDSDVKDLVDSVSLEDLDHTLYDFYLSYGKRLMKEGELTKAIHLLKLGHNFTADDKELNLLLGRCHHGLMNQVRGLKTKEELLKRTSLLYNKAGDISLLDKAVLLIDRGLINEGIYHLKALESDEARLKLAHVYLDLSDYKSAYEVLEAVSDKASDTFKGYFIDTLIKRREYTLAHDLLAYASLDNQLKIHMLFGEEANAKAIVEEHGPLNCGQAWLTFERLIDRKEADILDILPIDDQTMWLYGQKAFEKEDLVGLTKMLYLHMSGAAKIFKVDEIFIALIHSLKRHYRRKETLDLKYEDLMMDYEGFRLETVDTQKMMKAFGIVKDTFALITKMDINIKNTYKDISVDLKLFMSQFESPVIQREIHQLLGYYDQANRLISEDLRQVDHYDAYLLRGINYQALGEYEYALLDFKSAWERDRDPEILYFKALNYFKAYRQYAKEKLSHVPSLIGADPIENMMIQTKESGLRKALKTLEDLLAEDKGYVEAAILYGEIAVELANTYIRANSDDDLKQVYTFFIKELPNDVLVLIQTLFEEAVSYYEKTLVDDMLYFEKSYPRIEEIKIALMDQFEIFKTLNSHAEELKVTYLTKL